MLLVDLSKDSIKAGFEIAHACRERCIAVIRFRYIHGDVILQLKGYSPQLVDDIEKAFDFSRKIVTFCTDYKKERR